MVKNICFGIGDVKSGRQGSRTTERIEENDMKTIVLDVKDKGDLNFILAAEHAAKCLRIMFEAMLRQPDARLEPSLKPIFQKRDINAINPLRNLGVNSTAVIADKSNDASEAPTPGSSTRSIQEEIP